MSTLYNLEPQPTAKAVLHTTSGDVLLELFAQQTPLTSRNFLQLCLDGYYDNTIFHRLVPNFIIQGGDPTGTGSGGESSYDGGAPFADEFHSRLKFNRRGLLGMANSGEKNDNGSQFFLTLGNTPELTGRNTMFGRIEGNTIFNLVKMGEADMAEEEGSERPLYPTRITGTEVLVNPFDDMVKRARVATRTMTEAQPKKKAIKKKPGKALLSFGGDEGDESSLAAPLKTAKFNPKLVSADRDTELPAPQPRPPKRPAPASSSTQDRPQKRRLPSPSTPPPPRELLSAGPRVRSPSPTPPQSPNPEQTAAQALLERTNAQIAALKSSLKRSAAPAASSASTSTKSALEAMIPATSTRGRKRRGGAAGTGGVVSTEEQRALDEFVAFRRKLDAAAAAPGSPEGRAAADGTVDGNGVGNGGDGSGKGAGMGSAEPLDEEALLCDLHFIAECQSCGRWDAEHLLLQQGLNGVDDRGGERDGDEEGGGAGWMAHKLSFARDRLGKDLEWKRQNEKELVVIDPREKERGLGIGERGRGRGRGRGNTGGGGGEGEMRRRGL